MGGNFYTPVAGDANDIKQLTQKESSTAAKRLIMLWD